MADKTEAEVKARQQGRDIEALLKSRGWTKRGGTWMKEWPEEAEE